MSLEVDKVAGYRELIIQPLGRQLDSLRHFTAGSILPSGQLVLVLDIANLMESSSSMAGQVMADQRVHELARPLALVVDDSLTVRTKTQDMLVGSGVDVSTCKDGLSALESLATQRPDIMIVDLEMPRLDGFGVLRGVAKTYPDLAPPVIIVSERSDVQTRQAALALGAVGFLAKPYSEAQLRDAMQAAGLRLPDLTIA